MPTSAEYAEIMAASYIVASIMALSGPGSYATALRRVRESTMDSHIMEYRSDSEMAMGEDAVSALIIAHPSVSVHIIQHAQPLRILI